MAESYGVLDQRQAATSATLHYTAPTGKATIVKSIACVNTHATLTSTIRLYIGGSVAANQWTPTMTLAPGESQVFDGTLTLDAGKTLYVQASIAAAVTVTISGVELDPSSSSGGSTTLAGLTDVTITAPASGNALTYNGSRWVNGAAGGVAAHQATHQTGGTDALTGTLDATARTAVRKNSTGSSVGARRQLNLIEGPNVTLTVADDAANEEIDVTITAATTSSGSGYPLLAITTISANTTLVAATHDVVLVDATAASRTVTLPAAASNPGVVFTVKKIDVSANTVTIDPNASETIEGQTTLVLNAQYQTITIVCNGTAWYSIDAGALL
jgi:hypothetical protein